MLMVIMSRHLSELLRASEPAFSLSLRDLERASGKPAADIRLATEIKDKVRLKLRELGLDVKDTSGRELYYALVGLAKLHDHFLRKAIGGTDESDVSELLALMKKKADSLSLAKKVWAVKPAVIKKLIKKTPPKKAMKQLGYKSVDSMLKRENLALILAAIRIAESQSWQDKLVKQYANLTPGDFETRDIEVLVADAAKWEKMAGMFLERKRHNIVALKELGAVVLLPLPVKQLPGMCITALPMLLHYMNELKIYSTFFKYSQVRPDFGDVFVRMILNDPAEVATVAGQNLHWRVIHRRFGRDEQRHPEIFEPHVQREDLQWRQAEDILYKIEPALLFWRGLDYVGEIDGRNVISFNLTDMAANYCNKLPYGRHSVYAMRENLWNEILSRYIGQDNLEREVLKQLDTDTIELETDMFEVAAQEGGEV